MNPLIELRYGGCRLVLVGGIQDHFWLLESPIGNVSRQRIADKTQSLAVAGVAVAALTAGGRKAGNTTPPQLLQRFFFELVMLMICGVNRSPEMTCCNFLLC